MDGEASYLFLGGLFPKEKEEEIFQSSIGPMQNAANVFQWNVINGFDQNLTKPIKILNSLYIGAYPKRYKKMFIPTYTFQHIKGAADLNVGFCNLTGYKAFSRVHTLGKEVKKWIKNTNGKKYIFAYAMTDAMVCALHTAKKMDPSVITCLFVPDLPEYMNLGRKTCFMYRLAKSIDIRSQKAKLSSIDMFVYLTKQMNNRINAKNYTVIEGIANDSFKKMKAESRLEKTILYTGVLNEKYGAKNLVDAFMEIQDPEYRLILCGFGELVTYIQEAQEKDKRIEFRGTVMHKGALSLQMQATVLVNPRQNNEEFTKYSFPSKNLEYLASGAPVIAYKLDGIPDEYDEYFSYVADDSLEALKNKIEEICSLPAEERHAIGQKSREFVLKEKSSVKQIRKLLDEIEKLQT